MSDFMDFLLSEYDHIADAHFETGKQVSTFFNYYLLILAAPVIIVTLTQNKNLQNLLNPIKQDEYFLLHWVAFGILLVIAIFGFCLSWIVMELQHDAILYARTVNGIRNYFYKQQAFTVQDEKRIRVLPRDVNKPDFYSYRHLGVIVFAFAFVNSVFLFASLVVFSKGVIERWTWVVPLLFLLSHFLLHRILSWKKTKTYGKQ